MQGPRREEFSRISTRARLCKNIPWKCRRPRAVEMHIDIWQEPFFARIYRKNAAPQERGPFCASLHKSHLREITEKYRAQRTGPPFCARDKSHLVRETTRKMPSPPFCANLRIEMQHALICYTNPALGTGTWLRVCWLQSRVAFTAVAGSGCRLNHVSQPCQIYWITPARGPNQGGAPTKGGWEVNVLDTSKSSYGTVTDEVRHGRNCSSRTFYVDLHRGAHKIFIEELPMSIPDEHSYKHQCRGSSRCQCKDLLRRIPTESPQDLHTRTCKKDREQDLRARTPKRIWRDRHKRTCCCWSGSYKTLIQEPPKASNKSFHTSTSETWHLQAPHARTS